MGGNPRGGGPMTDYTPSPELVEDLVAFAEAHNEYEQCASQLIGGWGEVADVENLFDHVLTAAVAYRTPEGHPELVPWVEVAALIEAARVAAAALARPDVDFYRPAIAASLRAALALWTQEAP